MNISVVGLGVEGQKATISLLKRDFSVYASDINRNIDLSMLEESSQLDNKKLDLEIGSHNLDKIYKSDAVVVSPSLFNKMICEEVRNRNIFISDVLTKHKSIKTIAVTGTNGKTTTSHMIYNILRDQGYNVLLGGNGGGGFSGYTELLLEANSNDYDYLVIEVCDMTLDYCNYVFDIDVTVVTNIGYDHMDVHESIDNYTDEIGVFIKDKPAILNKNDENLLKVKDESSDTLLFDTYRNKLNLYGEFNFQNAAAATTTCNYLGIQKEDIVSSLSNFKSVAGRTMKIDYNSNLVVAGKTDNVNALKAVLQEEDFNIVIIGTPRENESFRYHILDYVKEYEPDTLIIFPGLEDITYNYSQYLNKLGYNNDVLIIKKPKDIINYINTQRNVNIFIGGNGQEKITKITDLLQKDSCN